VVEVDATVVVVMGGAVVAVAGVGGNGV